MCWKVCVARRISPSCAFGSDVFDRRCSMRVRGPAPRPLPTSMLRPGRGVEPISARWIAPQLVFGVQTHDPVPWLAGRSRLEAFEVPILRSVAEQYLGRTAIAGDPSVKKRRIVRTLRHCMMIQDDRERPRRTSCSQTGAKFAPQARRRLRFEQSLRARGDGLGQPLCHRRQ